MRLADFIAGYLNKIGVKHVFMVTGGGAMHLNDAFGFCPGIECVFNHHEQACAIAAEGYARTTGKLAVVNVTTGPGGLNTLTGLMGQWTDSVPVLYISGQVKFETTIYSQPDISLRQLGDQETDIISVVRPLTKYAKMVTDPMKIREELDKAIGIALSGRPGPVWLDIPMNVQSAQVDENKLSSDSTIKNPIDAGINPSGSQLQTVIKEILESKRPVFLAGHGIRLAHAIDKLNNFISKIKIPVLSSFNGFDLIETGNPLFAGRIGTIGNRSGNFALQNADLLLSVGSRNNIRQISYSYRYFARSAKKIVVDIDKSELLKNTMVPDISILADAGAFLDNLTGAMGRLKLPDWSGWLDWCIERKNRYFIVPEENKREDSRIDPYFFCSVLSECLPDNAIVVAGNATPSIAYFQNGIVRKGQRVIWNSGCAAMGYDLPAAIGACFAGNKKDVICLCGDGSLQMNIQELMTVSSFRLPIKLFYFNNNGYISIKQTQDNFFGRRTGTDPSTGVGFPDIRKIADAYGIPSMVIENQKDLKNRIKDVLSHAGPLICELKLPEDYEFKPKLSSQKLPDGRIISKPLEDLYPFLSREELRENMIVPLLDESE